MNRHPLLTLAPLALAAASLIGLTALPAQAQTPHRQDSHRQESQAATRKPAAKTQNRKTDRTPDRSQSSQSRHQKSCASRFKSYNPKSDTYVSGGKRIRCAL